MALRIYTSNMKTCAQALLFAAVLLGLAPCTLAADARFDLVGPRIDIRVTRGAPGSEQTLPIASVPNLQPGDRLWIHPDLPSTQSVKYLLICAFLRGTTNPPPDNWFLRVETWKKEVRDEGVFVTVPAEAQQAVLFMAPETGGDFSTLKSSVRGRPGVFVRASQDLDEASFEQARIERYLADIRRVPASDANELQKRSDLLARTLALKPNADCFKRSLDVQFTCLTQTGTQTLLDDGHGQNIVSALSTGSNSDFIQAASYTGIAGAGVYSAYVGAIVDLVRIMSNLHTAQYQYIPAISFPQGDALNLRLNTPPSFHNPKSVLVIGLPSIQPAKTPPLRPATANETVCLLKPQVVLPIEGAPLVFSTDFATHLVLHLNTPPGAPEEPDIPLVADAFEGGLVLQGDAEHRTPLRDSRTSLTGAATTAPGASSPSVPSGKPLPEPVTLTGTIQGRWGFDTFSGPTLNIQQLPGGDWHVVSPDGSSSDLIAGKSTELVLASTGSACVHAVSAEPPHSTGPVALKFKFEPKPDASDLLAVSLPGDNKLSPGSLHLQITQYGQPAPNLVAAQTFAAPPHLEATALPAGDKSMLLTGTHLSSIQKIVMGDLVFTPVAGTLLEPAENNSVDGTASLRLSLGASAPSPPTRAGERLSAQVLLNDGRQLPLSLTVLPPRPTVTLISHTSDPLPNPVLTLSSADDLPLAAHLTFTLKSRSDFPRNGRVEVETLDGTLRTVLTLAPSGGLVLQDPHTVVASLEPLRSFGPSAFGALRLRAIFPPPPSRNRRTEAEDGAARGSADEAAAEPTPKIDLARVSDWVPLGMLVREPALAHLQCTPDPTAPCTLTGSDLFLLQALSADPAFTNAVTVPDGFTGTTLPVPHPAGSSATLFVKLRDDPQAVDAAVIPSSSPATQASAARVRSSAPPHN